MTPWCILLLFLCSKYPPPTHNSDSPQMYFWCARKYFSFHIDLIRIHIHINKVPKCVCVTDTEIFVVLNIYKGNSQTCTFKIICDFHQKHTYAVTFPHKLFHLHLQSVCGLWNSLSLLETIDKCIFSPHPTGSICCQSDAPSFQLRDHTHMISWNVM